MSNLALEIRPTTSCDYHRIILPFKYLSVEPKIPVYVFNRIPGLGKDLLTMKRAGWGIVCDVDDYWVLDKNHYLHDSFVRSGMSERIKTALKLADIVTTTTAELAGKIKELNKNVHVIPNALPFDTDQFTKTQDKASGRTFVWAGGASHKHDLAEMAGLFKDVEVAGYNPHSAEWNAIREVASGAIFTNEKMNTSYMSVYDGHRAALAPLLSSDFNECKSNLKVLEAGAKRIPIITSMVKPYLNDVDRNVVTYCSSKSEWAAAMKSFKANSSYTEDAGERLGEHVRKHYHLSNANIIRKQLLESFT